MIVLDQERSLSSTFSTLLSAMYSSLEIVAFEEHPDCQVTARGDDVHYRKVHLHNTPPLFSTVSPPSSGWTLHTGVSLSGSSDSERMLSRVVLITLARLSRIVLSRLERLATGADCTTDKVSARRKC